MRLQGKIPLSAIDVAVDLRSQTNWQKYITYEAIMDLAIAFQDVELNGLEFEPQSTDVHNITSEFANSDEVKRFRRRIRATSNAAFFRHGMFHGAKILRSFMSRTLPDDVNAKDVYDCIAKTVGKNTKYIAGLAWLLTFVESA